mgnify:CR=1 FL=1
MARVKITETVLRDGHQSIAATRMRLRQMLPVLEAMDEVGYNALECWGGATFDTCMRFLDEDPWERLRTIKKHVKKTPLQMLFRGQNILGYRHYADDASTNSSTAPSITVSTSSASSTPSTTRATWNRPSRRRKTRSPSTSRAPWSIPSALSIRWNRSPRSPRNCRTWASTPSASRICPACCHRMTHTT